MNSTKLKRNGSLKSKIGISAYLPIIIIILIGLFSFIQPRFLRLTNFINLSRQSSFLAILSCGQILVVLT